MLPCDAFLYLNNAAASRCISSVISDNKPLLGKQERRGEHPLRKNNIPVTQRMSVSTVRQHFWLFFPFFALLTAARSIVVVERSQPHLLTHLYTQSILHHTLNKVRARCFWGIATSRRCQQKKRYLNIKACKQLINKNVICLLPYHLTHQHRLRDTASSRKLLCEWDKADQPILTAVSRESSEWWKKKNGRLENTRGQSGSVWALPKRPKMTLLSGRTKEEEEGELHLWSEGFRGWTGGSGFEDLCWGSECKGSSKRGTWAAVPLITTKRQEKGKIPQSEKLKANFSFLLHWF